MTENAPLRPLTAAELAVVTLLIADAESMAEELKQVLPSDEPAVREVLAARSWLRGIRDTRMLSSGSDPDALARLVHEQRLAHEADRAAAEGRQRFNLGAWEDRTEDQHELDRRIASAVAVQAVHDAGLEVERMRAQLFALGAHAPAIRRALTIAISETNYEAEARPYRTALQALGISDEKEAGNG